MLVVVDLWLIWLPGMFVIDAHWCVALVVSSLCCCLLFCNLCCAFVIFLAFSGFWITCSGLLFVISLC